MLRMQNPVNPQEVDPAVIPKAKKEGENSK